MKRGLVFGKFYPFHKGHEALINFARQQCDYLTVLVCASGREKISSLIRAEWIQKTYADDRAINVQRFDYDETVFPNSSVSSRDVSKIWSQQFKRMFPDINLICTSEPYGEFVAEYMGISHVAFSRQGGISATLIREDPSTYWDYLNSYARHTLTRRVVIAGTESTGKSTLAQKLAHQFRTVFVHEAGRDISPQTERCTESDLYQIGARHASLIREAQHNARRVMFIDTDIYTTVSYARFLFGKLLVPSHDLLEANRADLHLYLGADAPYVQDGTRLSKRQRDALDRCHRETYEKAGVKLHVLEGGYADRESTAKELVQKCIQLSF